MRRPRSRSSAATIHSLVCAHEMIVRSFTSSPRATAAHSSPPAMSAVLSTSTHPAASSCAGNVESASGSTMTPAGWW